MSSEDDTTEFPSVNSIRSKWEQMSLNIPDIGDRETRSVSPGPPRQSDKNSSIQASFTPFSVSVAEQQSSLTVTPTKEQSFSNYSDRSSDLVSNPIDGSRVSNAYKSYGYLGATKDDAGSLSRKSSEDELRPIPHPSIPFQNRHTPLSGSSTRSSSIPPVTLPKPIRLVSQTSQISHNTQLANEPTLTPTHAPSGPLTISDEFRGTSPRPVPLPPKPRIASSNISNNDILYGSELYQSDISTAEQAPSVPPRPLMMARKHVRGQSMSITSTSLPMTSATSTSDKRWSSYLPQIPYNVNQLAPAPVQYVPPSQISTSITNSIEQVHSPITKSYAMPQPTPAAITISQDEPRPPQLPPRPAPAAERRSSEYSGVASSRSRSPVSHMTTSHSHHAIHHNYHSHPNIQSQRQQQSPVTQSMMSVPHGTRKPSVEALSNIASIPSQTVYNSDHGEYSQEEDVYQYEPYGTLEDDSEDNVLPSVEEAERVSEYPDSSRANRRPPIMRSLPHEIPCKYDVKVINVSGDYICTSSSVTKIWSITSGQCIGHIGHTDFKVTAMCFKPSRDLEEEGKILWLGTKDGSILEADLDRLAVVDKRFGAHNAPIKGIYRCGFEMWTLDEVGKLQIWGPDEKSNLPHLNQRSKSQRIPIMPQLGLVIDTELWVGRKNQIMVYNPSYNLNKPFSNLMKPILASKPVGEITCGAAIATEPDTVYFGHDDGKISVFSRSRKLCIDVVTISIYKITGIASVGNYLWVAFRTGMIYVYDTRQRPWVVMKDWKAHEGPINNIVVDRSSIFKTGMLPVISLTSDNILTVWDGMLKQDWLELNMQDHDAEYCTFRTVRALICTWNVGAAKPSELNLRPGESTFFTDLVDAADDPEFVIFTFQELVELDNKAVTAKSMFKKRSKEKSQPHVSHQYRAWQDHLTEALSYSRTRFSLLHTDNLVGLYTCIFIKESEKRDIRNLRSAVVKTGLGGLHGNKGALIARFTIDDSSLCFVNCHLAAGQSHIIPRNNDIATIMESKIITSRSVGSTAVASDTFVGGGDGSMILDHESCFVSGDMNYRINLHRTQVLKLLEARDMERILASDQLLLQLKKNPRFRLRPFSEIPITFPPTYKYDIGSDTYDTSEKKRIPAWCDRIFYRGPGKIFPVEYKAHDMRISDHRPVSGIFDIKVKTIDPELRKDALKRAKVRWKQYVQDSIDRARYHFFENEQKSR
ncbi:Endonuclease/exonuclease/phosphatase [Dipodascopsis uninucleata]